MIDQFVDFCFQKRLVAVLLAVFFSVYGIYAWSQLPIDAYPVLSDVAAQVTTQAPGLAAEEVEQQVTIPLERALNGVPGLVSMRSSSTFGLSLITMVFRDGAEDYWERQRVTERISGVTLPSGITPSLDPVTSPEGEIYRYTLESDSKNLMELSEIQKWIVIPALQQVPGVANVDNFGGFTREFRLDLDPTELLRYGVGLNDVIGAINANSANAGGSRVARGEQSYVVRGIGLVHTLDDLGNIVVTQRGTMPILVRDLGTLSYNHQERQGILGKNENPDTLEGIVQLLKYQNASQVIRGVHAKIEELRKQLDPQDVRIVPLIDREDLVRATVSKVSHTVLEGIGLVCIVLIMFLGSPRSAIVVAVTIPLAMFMAFILMDVTKMSASMLSLGAIDFGVIVDGAIVVTENILRRREQKPNEALTPDDVRLATTQVARPIFFATLIIITAYFPLFALERGEARLFTPMAYTVGYAVFGALLCTLALIPGLAYAALRKPGRTLRNRPLEWLSGAYRAALGRLIDRPRFAAVIVAAALVLLGALGLRIGRDYLPELDEGGLWLQVQMPTGLSLDAATEMASQLRRALLEFPEVSYVVTQTGRTDEGVDPWTPSHVEVPVGLTPYDTWPAGETKADLIRKVNDRLAQIPGISTGVSQPISDMINDLIAGAHSPLVIRNHRRRFRRDAPHRRTDCRGITQHQRHRERIDLPGTADPPDRDPDRSRGDGALWHQCVGRHQSDPDGSRWCSGHPGLCRRPHLQCDGAISDQCAQQCGNDRRSDLDRAWRGTSPTRASREHSVAQRREHDHAVHEPPQSHDPDRPRRPGPGVLFRRGAIPDRPIGAIRPEQISARICRSVRKPAAGAGATRTDPGPGHGPHDAPAVRRVRQTASVPADPGRGAVGCSRRRGRALRHGHDSQCCHRGRIYRAVRRCSSERDHHGGQSQSRPRNRMFCFAMRC